MGEHRSFGSFGSFGVRIVLAFGPDLSPLTFALLLLY